MSNNNTGAILQNMIHVTIVGARKALAFSQALYRHCPDPQSAKFQAVCARSFYSSHANAH